MIYQFYMNKHQLLYTTRPLLKFCVHTTLIKKIKIASLNMGYISISLSNKALVQVVAPQWKNTQFQVQSVEMQGSSKELEKKKRRLVLVH